MMGDFTHLAASLVPWNRKSKSYSTQDSGAETAEYTSPTSLLQKCPYDMSLSMSCSLNPKMEVRPMDSLVRI